MTTAAWVMLVVGSLVLFGGLAVCVGVAIRVDRRKREQGIGFLDQDNE
jgi:hypothetical protein